MAARRSSTAALVRAAAPASESRRRSAAVLPSPSSHSSSFSSSYSAAGAGLAHDVDGDSGSGFGGGGFGGGGLGVGGGSFGVSAVGGSEGSGGGGNGSSAQSARRDSTAALRIASAQGHLAATYLLARSAEQGLRGLDPDLDEAVRLYRLAAASGHSLSISDLRRLGYAPSGALICRACASAPPAGAELQPCGACKEAHYCSAGCLAKDRPRHEEECQAARARCAAQAAALAAQAAAQQRCWDSPLTDLRADAGAGDAAAQCVVAWCYSRGTKGFLKSPELAAEWRTRAAAGGDALVQLNLGSQYALGEGVVHCHSEAVRLFRLAAKQGLRDAMRMLALKLAKGEGCERDAALASQWLHRAVELGDVEGQAELARWYSLGECGLPIHYEEAMRLSRLAAAQGNTSSMCRIGLFYRKGRGVTANLDESRRWYIQAAAKGSESARNILKDFIEAEEAAVADATEAKRKGLFGAGGPGHAPTAPS